MTSQAAVEVLALTAVHKGRNGRTPRHVVVGDLRSSFPDCSDDDIANAIARAIQLKWVREITNELEIINE